MKQSIKDKLSKKDLARIKDGQALQKKAKKSGYLKKIGKRAAEETCKHEKINDLSHKLDILEKGE